MDEDILSGNVGGSIAILCRRVEVAANLQVRTSRHFEMLSDMVRLRTGVRLSPTTLKRIWGYLDEQVNTRRSTLDVLARFCGWRDYTGFLTGDTPDIESGNVGSRTIRVDADIRRGGRVRLFWNPSRVCEIEYQGNSEWKVVCSGGTRLKPGDTFRCPMIVSGEPLYLDGLIKEGADGGVYVCGRKSGVTFEIINPD
ncbi:MAG: hypothetical protein K2M03_01615 [Muribaculaceae bacterium]|nr:hypothetical protein [Muribaculaceae bacterium]